MSDLVSPWTVGRYSNPVGAQSYAEQTLRADILWLNSYGKRSMPVIFPGFSWHNLQVSGENPHNPGPYNQIPRKQNGVYLLDVQGLTDIKAGAQVLYVAMFDEMNEGTAIFKCSRNPPNLADGLKFVAYEEESDFYLKKVGELGNKIKEATKEFGMEIEE